MQCPDCGGEVYDNRQKNAERQAAGKKLMPDFKCKDADGCGWKKWPPRGKQQTAAGKAPAAPTNHRDALALVAAQFKAACVITADVATKLDLTKDMQGEDRRTVFIELARKGIDPRKAVRAATAPAPEPEPEPEQVEDDLPL